MYHGQKARLKTLFTYKIFQHVCIFDKVDITISWVQNNIYEYMLLNDGVTVVQKYGIMWRW
jgi:hypothetical protein